MVRRRVLALPSWRARCLILGTVMTLRVAGSEALESADDSDFFGADENHDQHLPSLEVPFYSDDAVKLATAKLHGLLALLDKSREDERRQRDYVEALSAGPTPPQAPPSHVGPSAEQTPSEQLRKKTMTVQEGFTETAAATLLGRRPVDEDAMLLSAPLPGHPGSFVKALFDGHGGHIVARKCSVIAPTFIGRMRDFSGDSFAEASFSLDSALRHDPEVPLVPGSTGIIAVMEAPDPTVPEFILHVANIGDSRLLVLHEDGTFTPMSADQKPNDRTEMARVRQAGGSVVRTALGVWRIDGRLALSRSFGDFRMKGRNDLLPSQQKVVALPHTRTLKVRPGDATNYNLEETAMRLVTTAYMLGSCDNISAMLVRILPTAFPAPKVTAAEVDVLGVRKERPAMLPSEATVQRSGAWTTEFGLHATLY
ncbi:hypothetical protein Emag_003657 [Eimeria magna]